MSNSTQLEAKIKAWAKDLGFAVLGITDAWLLSNKDSFKSWLKSGFHGQMSYMERWVEERFDPMQLLSDTKSVIMVGMYFREQRMEDREQLGKVQIANYARGRDYHKILRSQFKKLIQKIENETGKFSSRFFVDSAPILEKSLAQKAGLGWIGKHTLLLNKEFGSFLMLGGICTDLSLQSDESMVNQCGYCEKCLKACPTNALISSYQLDARRCIAYLTMEYEGVIPDELASKMGLHIFGCDECQLACPWNHSVSSQFHHFASLHCCHSALSAESKKKYTHEDFSPREIWFKSDLVDLLNWSEEEFLKYTEGSSIRRIGYEKFIRNVAVALGNSQSDNRAIKALKEKLKHKSTMIREQAKWAIEKIRCHSPVLF